MPEHAPAESLYLNRELSWLAFNARVLHEATDGRVPLLERVKFLSIFSSNLDEYFMVRVGGLRRQLASGIMPRHAGRAGDLRAARVDQGARRRSCSRTAALPRHPARGARAARRAHRRRWAT